MLVHCFRREGDWDVKESPSYIGLDYDTKLKSIAKFDKKKTHVLPDRNIISVGAVRFRCAEKLCQPGFIDREAYRIHDISFQNVMKCDVDTRKDLYDIVVLSGGTTIFQGIGEHMNGPTVLAPSTMRFYRARICHSLRLSFSSLNAGPFASML